MTIGNERSSTVKLRSGQGVDGSLTGAVTELQKGVVALADHWLGLIAVEVRLAGISLSFMLALAICGAVLGAAAWLTLMAAAALWTVNQGVRWEIVLLGLSGINAMLALSTITVVRYLSRNLLFQTTHRQLRSDVESAGSDRA